MEMNERDERDGGMEGLVCGRLSYNSDFPRYLSSLPLPRSTTQMTTSCIPSASQQILTSILVLILRKITRSIFLQKFIVIFVDEYVGIVLGDRRRNDLWRSR